MVLLLISIYWFADIVHTENIKRNSKFAYTIAEITDYYHKGVTNGKELTYHLGERKIVSHCMCTRAKIGDRYLVKVFLEDQEVFEILFHMKVPKKWKAPANGWESIPKFVD
ncbi:MAG: hypothetical protein ACKOE6_16420 [Flammeovirgaceae bacterium]